MAQDETVTHIPTIAPVGVRAAVASCFDRMEEIRREMPAKRASVEGFRRSSSSPPDGGCAASAMTSSDPT